MLGRSLGLQILPFRIHVPRGALSRIQPRRLSQGRFTLLDFPLDISSEIKAVLVDMLNAKLDKCGAKLCLGRMLCVYCFNI
jgi:hypothetical protein